MKIIQAIHVGNNVTNIMRLPCIEKCVKRNNKNGLEWLEYVTTDGGNGNTTGGELEG